MQVARGLVAGQLPRATALVWEMQRRYNSGAMITSEKKAGGRPLSSWAARWGALLWKGDLSAALIGVLPAALIFLTFNIFPTLYSGYLSLHEWDGLSPNRVFVGLANYLGLFRSQEFWNSLGVTIYYMLGVTALGLAAGLVAALVLNRGLAALPFYRTLYFIPVITSAVAAAVVWRYLFDPGSGFVNVTLRNAGLPAPAWLADPGWAMPAVILVGVWKRLGFNMVIYLAGLQSIPREYYEAAKIDGAGTWALFRHVTVPLLTPITTLLVIMSVIDSFLVFDLVYVMTGGGPIGATDVVSYFLYRHAFRYFEMGTASAVGWVIFAIVFFVTLVQWRLSGLGTRLQA